MKELSGSVCAVLLSLVAAIQVAGAIGGADPRAMGLAQAYTAYVRGPAAVFWNPANLGLSGSPRFSWQVFGGGGTVVTGNNAWSVSTYNDYFTDANEGVSPRGTKHYISPRDKARLLADVPQEGLRLDAEFAPLLALGIPVNGGIAFRLPGNLQSALSLGLAGGLEGAVPRDMIELSLFGNEFAADRVAAGKPESYDIGEWDGSTWLVGSVNWAAARPWMPARLAPYLSEFAVGGTVKLVGGVYGEVVDSGGTGLVSRMDGAAVDAYLISQVAGGSGVGLDLGVAGITQDGRTTFSVGLLNALDYISWGMEARQDSVFVSADQLLVTRVVDPDVKNIEDVLDNEDVDGDGDADFHAKLGARSFGRSLPAMLRLGVAYEWNPRLHLMGAYDQAFSTGFGLETTPRLAVGAEYCLVPWFPVRGGLSVGGHWSSSAAVGFAVGPFRLARLQLHLLDTAWVTRGGFFPGLAKGTAVSVRFLELVIL